MRMRIRRRLLITITLAALLIAAAAAAQTPPSVAPPPTAPAPAPAEAQAPLQVYTKPIEPFSFQRDGKEAGFSMELWERIAREMGVTYEIHWVKTVSELIDTLKTGKADVGIAAISITADREKAVDFSTPFYHSGLGILVKAQGKGALDIAKETFWSRGVLKGFLFLIGLLVVIAHLIWFFERTRNPEQFPKPYLRGVWESAWWAISTILSGGCDAKGPMAGLGRLIGALWMLVCIVVITYFTAAVTTVMTVSQLSSDISGPGDLPGKKVATVTGSTAEKYLKLHGAKVSAFETIDKAYEAFDKREVVAVVYDRPILAYHVKMAGSGGQSVVGLFEPQDYGVGMQEGSKYRKAVNTAILKLAEEGVIDDLRVKWFGQE